MANRDRRLAGYLRREVAAHSVHHRRVLETVGGRGVRSREDLSRLPLTVLAEVDDPAALVLRPTWSSLSRAGDRRLAARLFLARVGGRRSAAGRLVERAYKPVHWLLQDGIPVGSSETDLERLGASGARWLSLAGVRRTDVLVDLMPPGPHLGYWQVVLGARHAGVSAVHLPPLPPAAQVARLRPTVLAGRPLDLVRLLEVARAQGRPLGTVHTLLALGDHVDPGLRARLGSFLEPSGKAVVAAWAPPGVRALWGECRGGDALHGWPRHEVLEIVDPLSGEPVGPNADGEVVWTPLGWHGTVLLRLRTGVFATLDPGPCRSCGCSGPLLHVTSSAPAFLSPLDHHAGVLGWQAELRTVSGHEELVVFLALSDGVRLEDVLVDLDGQLSATQYVVLDRDALDARLAAHGDRRLVDLRE